MFKSELIKTLEAIPGDGIVTDCNGAQIVRADDSSYYDDTGDDDGPRDCVTLWFEGDL